MMTTGAASQLEARAWKMGSCSPTVPDRAECHEKNKFRLLLLASRTMALHCLGKLVLASSWEQRVQNGIELDPNQLLVLLFYFAASC